MHSSNQVGRKNVINSQGHDISISTQYIFNSNVSVTGLNMRGLASHRETTALSGILSSDDSIITHKSLKSHTQNLLHYSPAALSYVIGVHPGNNKE